jgi:hypothetical protein
MTAALLALAGAGAADARAASEPLRIVSAQAIIGTEGGDLTLVGDLAGTLGSEGAAVTNATLVEGGLTARFTVFTARGTLRGRAAVDATAPGTAGVPDSSTYDGSARIVGGTGAYRGARGRATVAATSMPGSIIVTFRLNGTLKLPDGR